MGNQNLSISELVAKVKDGRIKLPEMQREYVWNAKKAANLLDSLYREYPTGTILTWDTNEKHPNRDFALNQKDNDSNNYELLLDGQQRLTSLCAVINDLELTVKNRKKPINIIFNLDHPENYQPRSDIDDENLEEEIPEENESILTFAVETKKLSSHKNWVSVTDALNSNSKYKFIKDRFGAKWIDQNPKKHELFDNRLSKLQKITEYNYVVTVLEQKLSYEEVAEIFVRVNSSGTTLKGSDLALALITAKWSGSLEIFKNYQSELIGNGYDIELGVIVRNLVSFATNRPMFNTVSKLTRNDLENNWENSKKFFSSAINFLKENIGIENSTLLSSPSIVVTIAFYLWKKESNKMTANEENLLRKWALIANLKGRFSRGSSEGYLEKDLAAINQDRDKATEALLEFLSSQFGRLKIEDSDLIDKKTNSGIFKSMYLAFSKNGAHDWHTNYKLSMNHSGNRDKLQFHHIFPKDFLKDKYEPKQINDICNYAFISGSTNRSINNKDPMTYLSDILEINGSKILIDQCIPIDKELWKIENYSEFLKERRKLVSRNLNAFIGLH